MKFFDGKLICFYQRLSVRTKLDEASIRAAIGGAGLVGVMNFAYGWVGTPRSAKISILLVTSDSIKTGG